jgi:hypothetical protein
MADDMSGPASRMPPNRSISQLGEEKGIEMKTTTTVFLAAVAASPAMAQDEHRELSAHEHGVGQLEIAIEGDRVILELHAPGADIVGFEHYAESAEDRAAIEDAVATLARPLDLFVLPEAAQCIVTEASAQLVAEEHEHHEDADRAKGEEHAEGQEHAEGEEHHKDEAEHEDGAQHNEFHAAYALTCADTRAIDRIEFGYFTTFPNARELEVRLVSDKGAEAFEVEHDAPMLNLEGGV